MITDLDVAAVARASAAVVTIGAYDGVHLGHQAVIADVRQLAVGAKAHGRSS